jgi:membrane-bound lytic murein transglycosylase D
VTAHAADPRSVHHDSLFPRGRKLADRIAFWTAVFTRHGAEQVVIHDSWYLDRIYTVLDLGGLSDKEAAAVVGAEKRRIRAVLLRLDDRAGDPGGLGPGERAIAALFRDHHDPGKFREAADRVRSQRGLRERFSEGLRVSRRYLPEMEAMFRRAGLPVELTRIPLIESCFDLRAYSWKGAAGVWQFMPQTGRLHGLLVDRAVDERRDPLRATEAAARYLADAHAELGTWPLAITSYNHGVKGIANGVRAVGSTDIERLIERYEGRAFGFAGQNFYAEFLAALDIERNPDRFFGPMAHERPVPTDEVMLRNAVSIGDAAEAAGLTREELAAYNPALSDRVLDGAAPLPRGYRVRVPSGRSEAFRGEIVTVVAVAEQQPVAPAIRATGGVHRVRRGETLSLIAEKYGTTVSTLKRLNGIRNPHLVQAGELVKVPQAGGEGTAVAAADRRYIRHRVRRGQTLSHIARRYGTSVGTLRQHNRIRNPAQLRTGQLIKVPGS